MKKAFLVFALACAEPQDASQVQESTCTLHYIEPADASVVVTLHVTTTIAPDLALRSMCIRLDGNAVLLAGTSEITTGKSAERDLRVTPGMHTFAARGEWVLPVSSGTHSGAYTFVAKSAHTFDASTVREVALAFEVPHSDKAEPRFSARWSEP